MKNVGKFEPRADEGILLGYSSRSKGYKCYNKRLGKIVESIDVVVDEACKNPKQIKSTKIMTMKKMRIILPHIKSN
jgi:hypothetical protein